MLPKRISDRIPRWEAHIAFWILVRDAFVFAGAIAVGWWSAARSYAEGLIAPYGMLGYVATTLTVALAVALVFAVAAWSADRLFRGRVGQSGDEKISGDTSVLSRRIEVFILGTMWPVYDRLWRILFSTGRLVNAGDHIAEQVNTIVFVGICQPMSTDFSDVKSTIEIHRKRDDHDLQFLKDSLVRLYDNYVSMSACLKSYLTLLPDDAILLRDVEVWRQEDVRFIEELTELLSGDELKHTRARCKLIRTRFTW